MLKVVVITQGLSRIVQPLIKNNCCQIVGIIESSARVDSESFRHSLRFRFVKILHRILFKRQINLLRFCREIKIPYILMTKFNSSAVYKWLAQLQPDLIVVYSMSQLLSPEFIRIPSKGIINLHPSYLPDYRGPNPEFWQYYDTVLNPGVTVHYIDRGEDTGDIIEQERVSVLLGSRSSDQLDLLIGSVGARLLLKVVEDIAKNKVSKRPQPTKTTTKRARNLTAPEHNKIVDWNSWSIERVWHLMRGTEGWLDLVEQPKGIFSGQRWVVGEYEHSPTDAREYGTVKNEFGYRLITRNGVIHLSIEFSIKRMLLRMLQYKLK